MISEKQKKILAFPYTNYDALICDGSIRSGKTSIMTVAFVDWAMKNFSGQNFAICGKTVGSAVRNIVEPYLALGWSKKYGKKFSRSDNKLSICVGGRRNNFYIFGGRDESSYGLIQGITLAGLMLDEVVLMPRSFIDQAIARCSIKESKYWINCNPSSPNHWFYTDFILKCKEKNILNLHFNLDDNPSLSEEIKNRYKSMYSGVFYDRYIEGQWKDADGILFPEFVNNPSDYIFEMLPQVYSKILIGVDFGGNLSQTAFCACGIEGHYNTVNILSDLQIPLSNNIDSDKICDYFLKFYFDIEKEYGKVDFVFCDSASPTLINSLRAIMRKNDRRYGNIAGVKKNKIEDRPQLIDLLMSQKRFKVHSRCTNTIKALSALKWDEKNPKIPEDKNIGNINDYFDAMCYCFIEYSSKLSSVKGL